VSAAVLGIRHHGPGSARSVLGALAELAPDCVLIEGPSDATGLLEHTNDPATEPPVALLAYDPKDPARCVFYPFASFSPEWRAIRWALERDVEVRFIDLPAAEVLAHREPAGPRPAAPDGDGPEAEVVADPLRLLAEAAGYEDPERWWEDMVEHRAGDLDTFAAIRDAMGAMRDQLGHAESEHERRREAFMRRQIAQAGTDGFERIAVVCGAWHAPVLAAEGRAPRPKAVRAPRAAVTWVPWTYDRLAYRSGYGAGVISPGWYEHLFETAEQPVAHWLSRAAQVLRRHDTDISTAHVIEAARTAQALAALRDRPLAGLPEITDALHAVLGEGADALLSLLREELVIGGRLGTVSDAVPTVPLQRDLEARQRSLRLKPDAAHRDLDLDLRKDTDLQRSHLLHRLALIGVPWGARMRVEGARGTFREAWRIQWKPEYAVRVIEASGWGPTVPLAATARVRERAAKAEQLGELTTLLEDSLLAELPDAVGGVLAHFEANAAVSSDVPALMGGLPALARAARYGSVRQTDVAAIASVLAETLMRVAVGLPAAASGLDEDAAADLVAHVDAVDGALGVLDDAELTAAWRGALLRTTDRRDAHPLVAGRACRILRDAGDLDGEQVGARMHRALSRATPALEAAAWLEGFLAASGLTLIHDPTLLAMIDRWLADASDDAFTTVVPVLRRTFSTFSPAERRQIGGRVRGDIAAHVIAHADDDVDHERGVLVVPVLRELLGVGG
jgi:hypothetical protein